MNLEKGQYVITRIYGAYYEIYSPETGLKRAVLRGKLRLLGSTERNPLTPGDIVNADAGANSGDDYKIMSGVERKNALLRKSRDGDAQALCANIDYAAILASLANPETKPGFIDRCLASCHFAGITPLIIFTKCDLPDADFIEEKTSVYRELGYNVMTVSAATGEGIEELRLKLKDKVTFLAGISGAGKSSLVNAVSGENMMKVGEVSHSSGKGKHTTTNSHMIFLPDGITLIDSPGIKEWGILHMKKGDIVSSFPEFFKIRKKCPITGCCNLQDGCLLTDKMDEKHISYERLISMEAMLESVDVPHRIRTGNFKSGKVRRREKNYD